ncbi:MAG TPA: response regulator [Candidatus Sumerlaeota bacterium]|nr:response regulator [Candidatus Sumerlaeota bacterium]HMX61709.1 response regulator [Candidatus Sumerlaeota bacterium]HMZ52335.1 response regulator [Candidatus Sumerlaeota bacterium]HNM46175.1 response regulator [Candidatus Sumerlaeota bacterium]
MSRKARILAVDDENDILLIVRTSLKDEYDVDTASSGAEALQKIQDNPPDLVILDMMMPEMDGIEVLEEIRRMTQTATTPVIFLTGVSDKAKIREALDKGTQYYITKPFNYNDLVSKVAIALNGN